MWHNRFSVFFNRLFGLTSKKMSKFRIIRTLNGKASPPLVLTNCKYSVKHPHDIMSSCDIYGHNIDNQWLSHNVPIIVCGYWLTRQSHICSCRVREVDHIMTCYPTLLHSTGLIWSRKSIWLVNEYYMCSLWIDVTMLLLPETTYILKGSAFPLIVSSMIKHFASPKSPLKFSYV